MLKPAICLLVACTLHLPAASFRNLGFEEAVFPFPVTPETVGFFAPGSDAAPGWSGRHLGAMNVNFLALGVGFTTLVAHTEGFPLRYGMDGTFHLLVSMGRADDDYYATYQRGTIPSDAGVLEFVTYGAPWNVSIDGVDIPLTRELLYDPNPAYRGFRVTGNIAAFAGQEVELRFTPVRSVETDYHGIDAIEFRPVPEPGILALLGLGGTFLLRARRRKPSGGGVSWRVHD